LEGPCFEDWKGNWMITLSWLSWKCVLRCCFQWRAWRSSYQRVSCSVRWCFIHYLKMFLQLHRLMEWNDMEHYHEWLSEKTKKVAVAYLQKYAPLDCLRTQQKTISNPSTGSWFWHIITAPG
jgi:hypothetical protein